MDHGKIIGIVGGVGPYAGIDLERKLFDLTEATRDQDHHSVVMASLPREIEDRTEFLIGNTDINPAFALARIIKDLADLNASIIGIACNTAHSPPIFDVILQQMEVDGTDVKLVHMIEEVADFITAHHPDLTRFGVLSTIGTFRTGIYQTALEKRGLEVILPDGETQALVHTAIYDPGFGIKSRSNPVSDLAMDHLFEGIHYLQGQDVEGIVLGCTEISMALDGRMVSEVELIDPTRILAAALIREATR